MSRWAAAVRPGEARAVRLSFLAFFLLTSALALLRPVREALGIEGGVERLPWMFTGTFVVTLLVIPPYSRLVARCARRQIVPMVMHVVAASLLLFHLALRGELPRAATGAAFFVWYSTLNLIIVAAFWSLMADLFRSEQGRRLFGYIAGGGSAGFIAGPLLAGRLVGPLGLPNLLLLSAVLLEGVVVCVHLLLRQAQPPGTGAGPAAGPGTGGRPGGERLGGSVWAGFTAAARQPYLRLLSVQ
ncbi:MAG TPA: MFS transporter, partial [Planctomycetota bacterium]|nr:MFS transporter [Planctomycetota bacterium]